MAEITDGGPAFPHDAPGAYESEMITHHGLSMRDYFAAQVIQAMVTNPESANGFTFDERAEWAYMQADAMLKAREVQNG